MKFLRDISEELEILTEEKNGKKDLFIHGVFMQADIPNKNKRIYPGPIMEKELGRYVKNVVNENAAVGELQHPTTPTINMDRVSHRITELKMEGSNIVGKALILNTPCGQIARALLEGGVRLGVSSRGLGSVKASKGVNVVQEDFKLVTVDLVNDPSAPNAFVTALMEQTEWLWDATTGTYAQILVEPLKEEIKKKPASRLDESEKLAIFQRFLDAISKPSQTNK